MYDSIKSLCRYTSESEISAENNIYSRLGINGCCLLLLSNFRSFGCITFIFVGEKSLHSRLAGLSRHTRKEAISF